MSLEKTDYNYQDLQESIDILLGKFGLQKTIEVLGSLSSNTSLSRSENNKQKLLLVFLISESIRVFDLQEKQFYTSSIQEYKEARMACYFLLKKYSDMSYAKIGEGFSKSKRAILYNYQKCEEMLSIGQFYKDFVLRFKALENNTINFIVKLG